MKFAISVFALALVAAGIALAAGPAPAVGKGTSQVIEKIVKTDAEWKKLLTPEQYNVLREHGTERAFTSPLNHEKHKGVFVCAACGLTLFSSDTKFDSGTGWPSFWQPIAKANIVESNDYSLGMARTKVSCAGCDSHLGHVFTDGPRPTGLRYCMNSVALRFVARSA